ncbi:unnamed protein product [Orchesella dallaii]|uniref:BTB domain-containing protein n=1 Tax=Orchesella dallaii TaxID=48710 RepID=A0ABP1RML5_9HEXA
MEIPLVRNKALSVDIGTNEVEHGFASWRANLDVTTNWENTPQNAFKSAAEEIQRAMASPSILCAHFIWTQEQPDRMHVVIHGDVLGRFRKICGDDAKIRLAVTYDNLEHSYQMHQQWYGHDGQRHLQVQRYKLARDRDVSQQEEENRIMNFNKTISMSEMTITSPKTAGDEWRRNVIQNIPRDAGCLEIDTFTEKIDFPVPSDVANVWELVADAGNVDFNVTVSLDLVIASGGIVADDPTAIFGKLSNTCESILSRKVNTDLNIIASNGAILECHKCFLSVNSPVLAAMLESGLEESKSSRIELVDVSENCVKALLEYLYTFKITQSRKCSILAVELFQVAHKYDIRQLEEDLAHILLAQVNSWYDVNAALDLFRFARNVEEHCSLKLKCVEVLQLNADELLKSEKYQGLFQEDLATAMELCAIALKQKNIE